MVDLLHDFVSNWFSNPEWWFSPPNPEIDRHLTAAYAALLDADLPPGIPALIVYDQLPRHIFRNELAAHVTTHYLHKALDVRSKIAGPPKTAKEFIFYQLPARHSKDPTAIHAVMAQAWAANDAFRTQDPDYHLFKRFLRATYDRCPRTAAPFLVSYPVVPTLPTSHPHSTLHSTPHSTPTHLHRHPPLHKTIQSFLATHGLTNTKVIVSLSGGVDSMVLLTAMCAYASCVAVHINYCNRATTDHEEDVAARYCQKLGVPLYVRRFPEISREQAMKSDMRDTYENYTRSQRYATYRDVASLNGIAYPPPVFMGHNEDDTIENILTNVAQKKKYGNLYGMQAREILDGIDFCRPMLHVAKTEIYEYAADHNVPHLPDSTLAWTQRGQIRNYVLPTLTTWEPRVIGGLHALTKYLQDMSVVAELQVCACVARTEARSVSFPPGHPPPTSNVFWRMYLDRVTNNAGISSKAINTLTERIARSSCGKVPLKKSLMATIQKHTDGSWVFSWTDHSDSD